MEKPKVTPKDFFLWAMAMIALYSSVFALITLLFSYIDYTFPDVLNSYVDPYGGAMRLQIATLVVMFPIFLALMRVIRRTIVSDPSRKDVWIRRWALYFTVFAAGLTMVIDLITLINYFLGGEITTRFILKVLVVLFVGSVAFMHFLADIWGYWLQYPARARMVGWGVGALVILSIAAGFFIMGSPAQIRLYRFDDQKISDLQDIQYQIVNYWQRKEALPSSLEELNDPLQGYVAPIDTQTKQSYEYRQTGPMSFELCATFNAPLQPTSPNARTISARYATAPVNYEGTKTAFENDIWTHGEGRTCFTRTIDPELYPPYNKQKLPVG